MEKCIRETSMRKQVTRVFLVVFAMLLVTASPAFAYRKTLSLAKNQVWTSVSDTRTGKYSYVETRCYAVYPTSGGTDTYSKVRVRVTSSGGTLLCAKNYYTLSETATSNKKIQLKDGYLNNTSIKFQFCGNTTNAVKADVWYDAK